MADANQLFDFAVQEYLEDGAGSVSLGEASYIQARSALEAAQMMLGEDLRMGGPRHLMRAKVVQIADDLRPIITQLYMSSARPEPE